MTVPVQTIVNKYTSAGTSTFIYSFQALSSSHIVVTVNGITKTIGTDYAVTGVGIQAGGTITGLATVEGDAVVIRRVVPIERLTDYQNNGDLLAKTLNPDFDSIWHAIQQHEEALSRTVQVPLSSDVPPTEYLAAMDASQVAALASENSAAASAAQALASQTDIHTNWEEKLAAADASASASEVSRVASGVSAAAALVSESNADTSESSALAAKVAAESARDAALIQAGIYTTEALGRAAVADGVAFKVQGSGDVAAYEYRRVNAGTISTLIATYPSSAAITSNTTKVADLYPAFTPTAPKNKYNPALAVDGQVYSYTLGTPSAFANTIISGHIPVSEGVTYTLSQKYPELGVFPNIYCWDAGGSYLGMAATVGGSPVVAGMGMTFTDAGGGGGYRSVTFTVPIGSGVAFVGTNLLYNYAVHTTPDFDRIRNATMLEIGFVATLFAAYTTVNSLQLNDVNAAPSTKAVVDAFTVTAGKNLYNKANATDGVVTGYGTGTDSAYAPGMALGKIPVSAGATYTASMGSSLGFHANKPIYCYNASGAYLGVDHTIGATPGMASPPTGVTWSGLSSVTFTIPPGSLIAYVSFQPGYSTSHTTDYFNAVIATVQVEVGSSATTYVKYAPYGTATLNADTANITSTPLLSVTKSGNDIYVRSAFTSSLDMVQKIVLATGAAFTNDTVNVQGARSIAREVTDNVGAWTSGTALQSSGDDSCPLNYNGTYIGANHGAFIVQEVTATAHGKAVQDVGSEWTDGAAIKWYLMRVVDANKLWLVSANLSVYPLWSFTASITGATLTHSSGATNTGAITVASAVTTQLTPALKDQVKTVLLDGITPVTADGTYRCSTLHIVESYAICNPAAVVTYVRGLVGSATQPAFNATAIDPDVRRTLTYQYAENGSCAITDGTQAINNLTIGYLGATQASPLTYSGKQLWQYIPRVTSKTNGSGTWNFAAQAQIDGTFEQINLTSANWTDANQPPDRLAQIVKTAGVSEFGLMVGYTPRRSIGVPALRKTLVNDACFISTARKQYPKAMNIGTFAAGAYYEIAAFRAYWSASAATAATVFTWYRDGKSVIVVADFHANVSLSPLVLPAQFTGMDVEVIDKTASLTLHGNGVLSAGGLVVSVTGGYGYGVFKLS